MLSATIFRMDHAFSYLDIDFTVEINAAPGRRTRWSAILPWTTLTDTASNREAALRDEEFHARIAIAERVEDHG